MKFSIDTKTKTLTLLEKVTFKEMDSLKKFIGENWREWSIEVIKVTEVQKEYINNWWYQYLWPINPYPTITYDRINGLGTSTTDINFLSSPDRSQFLVSGSLGTSTMTDLLID